MDIKEIGQNLKKERERQGLSLEEVYNKTKISPSTLQYIENGEINELPHPVYAKGFIKNYAHMLGLDAEEYARLFDQNVSEEELVKEEEERISEPETIWEEEKADKKWTVFSLILSAVLLIVLVWLVYDVFLNSPSPKSENIALQQKGVNGSDSVLNASASKDDHAGMDNETGVVHGNKSVASLAKEKTAGNQTSSLKSSSESTVSENQKMAAKENTEASTESSEAMEAGQEEAAQTQGQKTLVQSNPEQATNQTRIQEDQVNTSRAVDQEEGQPRAAQESGHTLKISAFEACWFSAEVDNRVKDIYLRPGESISLHFQNELKIKLGNAGGVNLNYDGKRYPLDASSGEVLTVRLP